MNLLSLIFHYFKFTSVQTGADIHTYDTRRRYGHIQIAYILDIAASLLKI